MLPGLRQGLKWKSFLLKNKKIVAESPAVRQKKYND
jgi:hypothetical protein